SVDVAEARAATGPGALEPLVKQRLVAVPDVTGRAALARPRFDVSQAATEVGAPARLRELAVVDDVDADIRLLAHDLADGAGDARVKGRGVVSVAGLTCV